jgi:GAF domain-containing protein
VGQDAVFFDNPDLPETRSEMALPLRARGGVIGALDVQSKKPEAFTDEDVAVLQTLADQVATAISNAQLFQQARESLEAQRRAYAESSREAWRELLQARPDLGIRYDQGNILPVDELQGTAQSSRHSSTETRDGGRGTNGQQLSVSSAPAATNGDDAAAPPRGDVDAEPVDELPELAVPLKVRGHRIGSINARKSDRTSEWTPEEISLIETLTEQLSLALDSARLYRDTQRRAAREQLIGEITARLHESLDVDTVLQTAVREIGDALDIAEVQVRMKHQMTMNSDAPSANSRGQKGNHDAR